LESVQEAAGFVWDKKQDDVKILAALSYVLLGRLHLEIATLPQTWTGLEKIKDQTGSHLGYLSDLSVFFF